MGRVAKDDLQENSRVGLTVAWQAARHHGLRFAASRGAFTRIGGDFTSAGITYANSWGGGGRPGIAKEGGPKPNPGCAHRPTGAGVEPRGGAGCIQSTVVL